jgi:hypothetical protein
MRFLSAALLACVLAAAPSAAGVIRPAQEPVAGSYIVVFNSDSVRAAAEPASQRPLVGIAARDLARAHGGNVTHVYQHALKGFSVRLTPAGAAALARNPRVDYVQPTRSSMRF